MNVAHGFKTLFVVIAFVVAICASVGMIALLERISRKRPRTAFGLMLFFAVALIFVVGAII